MMECPMLLSICCLVFLHPCWVRARTPNTKAGLSEEPVPGAPKPPLPTESPTEADRCRGYYDVMGQWDPPFNCNASSYLYCCGTCGYRFCCQFKHGRLDQSMCSNYDTPNWANTGKPPARGDDSGDDPSKDKTNMIVYIICGVAALMVLIGIFTKLAVEKTQRPQTDMNVSRTLTDLLKQPAQIDLLNDGHRGSVQVQITEVIPRISPRNSIDHSNFNNVGLNSHLVPQIGLSLAHNNRAQLISGIPLQDQEFSKNASIKTSENPCEDFYKRFPVVDVAESTPCYQPNVLIAQDSAPIPDNCPQIPTKTNHKIKVSKTNTHPLAGATFQRWDPNHHDMRRQVYANKRQYSIEKLPELLSHQSHYTNIPQRHCNSKTEVTV
ncbi:protein shisa-8 isoform X1 [Engystomops pustulosus]|uniref:protein shisa-8 isoform X1 n=1 Tax=Engystomops pustulosus TaxID=76066 RepID=UPI003AFB7C70